MAAGLAAIGMTCMLWCRLPPLVDADRLAGQHQRHGHVHLLVEVDAQEVDVDQPARQRIDLRVADHRRHLLGLAAAGDRRA